MPVSVLGLSIPFTPKVWWDEFDIRGERLGGGPMALLVLCDSGIAPPTSNSTPDPRLKPMISGFTAWHANL